MSDDKSDKLTPEQLKRWKELGWGESDEEFDERLARENAALSRFENDGLETGFIPSEKPRDTWGYHRFNLSVDCFKDAFKRWFG